VLLQGKKIAGVLVEQRNQVFVVGFGINLTIPHVFFERNNYDSAGAVQHFITETVRRETVWSSLLQYLNQSYAIHSDGNAIPLLANFRRFSALEGREVLLTAENLTYAGCIRQLQLDEIHLETKRGVCVFAPESISRIQMNFSTVDQWCSVQNPPD
jgi:biotin-(acetyl-CoA carboxylase) ligase